MLGSRSCSGTRKRLWCKLENALYALGGRVLAAIPFVVLAVVLLYASVRRVLHRHRNGYMDAGRVHSAEDATPVRPCTIAPAALDA